MALNSKEHANSLNIGGAGLILQIAGQKALPNWGVFNVVHTSFTQERHRKGGSKGGKL